MYVCMYVCMYKLLNLPKQRMPVADVRSQTCHLDFFGYQMQCLLLYGVGEGRRGEEGNENKAKSRGTKMSWLKKIVFIFLILLRETSVETNKKNNNKNHK
jgi:hypothetical protein